MTTEETVVEELVAEEPVNPFENFSAIKVRLDRRITDWSEYCTKAKQNRVDRYLEFDVEAARRAKDIEEDETIVPTRVIDSNLVREKADAMSFLNSGKRLAYFQCLDDPSVDTRQLESDVTKGLTYRGWYKEFDRHYDSAGLHGWDSLEILFDESKPLHVGFELIGHENLLFNPELQDIQDDEFILIRRKCSAMRLEEFVRTYSFNKEQVERILKHNKDTNKQDNETYTIYKVYYKFLGQVYICWYSKDGDVSDFLKAPEPFISGILEQQEFIIEAQAPEVMIGLSAPVTQMQWVDSPATRYPIELYIYKDDEQECIVDHKGRALLDAPQQEARTAIKTAFVNGIMRASNSYASVDSEDPEMANRLEEEIFAPGHILKTPIKWHNQPYPDPMVIQAMQWMDMENSQQSGKMAVAVSNRPDARKTSTELNYAHGEEQKITSVNLATYSEFLRELYSYAWEIIQSRALADLIPLCKTTTTVSIQGPAPGLPGIPQTQTANNFDLISKTYEVRAAGEIDVVQKQQRLAEMQQDWPVIQTIPGLSQIFMQDFIRLRYPEKADQYIAAMMQGNPGKQVAQSLLSVVQGSLQPEEVQALDPQKQQELQQVIQTAQQYISNPSI